MYHPLVACSPGSYDLASTRISGAPDTARPPKGGYLFWEHILSFDLPSMLISAYHFGPIHGVVSSDLMHNYGVGPEYRIPIYHVRMASLVANTSYHLRTNSRPINGYMA
jgi:hypothetical protein